MEDKHTPGPWELDPKESAHVISEDYHVIRAGCGFCAEAKDVRKPGFSIAGHMTPADARLMTAAPDLLVALKMFVWPYQEGDRHTDTERQEIGRAAVAKAIGEATLAASSAAHQQPGE